MDHLADGLLAAADALTTVHRTVPALTVPAGVFAADDEGVPGRLGHRLHAHWSAVLTARGQEAAAAAAHLTDLAAAARETRSRYDENDRSIGHRIKRTIG